jgi:hypothetical protein
MALLFYSFNYTSLQKNSRYRFLKNSLYSIENTPQKGESGLWICPFYGHKAPFQFDARFNDALDCMYPDYT